MRAHSKQIKRMNKRFICKFSAMFRTTVGPGEINSGEEEYDGPPRTPDEWLDPHVSGVIQDTFFRLKEDLRERGFQDILDRLELADFTHLAVQLSSSCPREEDSWCCVCHRPVGYTV